MIRVLARDKVKEPLETAPYIYDLFIPEDVYVTLFPYTTYSIPLNVAYASNKGHAILSMRFKYASQGLVMPHGIGIIHPNPDKEIILHVYNINSHPVVVETGMSICQLITPR